MSLHTPANLISPSGHITSKISEGDIGLAYSPDQKRYHPIKIESGFPVKLWKFTINPNGAIGHWYGTRFIIKGENLEVYNACKLDGKVEETAGSGDSVRDNRNLLDVATNQNFSRGEIEELKEKELEPEQLIGQILSGSNTFREKTEYSQQKYLSKKRAKHMPIIFIYRPSLRHLALMHYRLAPERIGFLRIDTLSQLLALANVRHGSRLLVVDNLGGLTIGASLERMGGGGSLVELFTTEIVHSRTVLSSFTHLSPQHWECLSAFPLRRLSKLTEFGVQGCHTPTESEHPPPVDDRTPLTMCSNLAPDSAEEGASVEMPSVQLEPLPIKTDKYSTARELLLHGEFDALIIATKHTPIPILELCLPFVSPSRPLLVYCVFSELISACHEYFFHSASIKLTQLSSSWLRDYQPLESRMHPEMTSTSSRTGYILHGVRVKTYKAATPEQKEPIPPSQGAESPESKRIKLLV